ncbi:nitroreductase family protein [Orrella marina]|uniref:Putative NAD(P)H nitroreductase n=1 Tax=Orrella marina TaxID=2163011 RepID=A0A2R4XGF2_9BURK|nr:nitroreductase [Orrella marina]AWB32906.1 nitroreductase [Orrella marina]
MQAQHQAQVQAQPASDSDVIRVLTSRRSVKSVVAPGPSRDQIELALEAAVRAPDHAALRVWRFAMIEQPDIVELGERAIEAVAKAGRPMAPEKQVKTREWLKGVPLLVAMAYQIHHDNPKVPELEQTLSMGAAVMNFQNAMHAMGYASFWSTGLGTFTEEVPTMLGFDTLDYRFVGFLAVGTPAFTPTPATRTPGKSILTRWTAPKA